jgi:GNAT superfamily N-acetyltransferase
MVVRLIEPADENAYRTILERMTDEDRYYRFLHPADALAPDGVRHFVESRPDMLGVIAVEDGEPLGAAHGALLDENSAELAIILTRGARGRGIGRALLLALINELRARGYTRFIANALHENQSFARLARSAGLHADHSQGSVVSWVRDLQQEALVT